MCIFGNELLLLKAGGKAACSSFTWSQKKKKKFLHIISVLELKSCGRVLLTLQLQLHRGLSGLKAGCQGAGLIFLHTSFICQTLSSSRGTSPLLPNTNEEASQHMWVVASLEASQSLHILSGTEVPDELGLAHTKPAIVRSWASLEGEKGVLRNSCQSEVFLRLLAVPFIHWKWRGNGILLYS